MCFKNYFKKLASFGLAFLFGLLVVGVFQIVDSFNKVQELLIKEDSTIENNFQKEVDYKNYLEIKQFQKDCAPVYRGEGYGQGSGRGSGFSGLINKNEKSPDLSKNKALNITYKPEAQYSEIALKNKIEGTVTVRVIFLASGEIGAVTPISGLPCGLTEQAIAAAKEIKFEPMIKKGEPRTVIRPVQFNFTIY
jgi:TonB family protein